MRKIKNLLVGMVTIVVAMTSNIVRADNTLDIKALMVGQGEKAVLEIEMNNTDNVTAFSFDLYLPDGIKVLTKSDGTLSATLERAASDHTVSGNYKDGYYSFSSLSLSSQAFSGYSGTVCKLELYVDKEVELGSYDVVMNNIEMTNPDNTIYRPDDVQCKLTVVNPADLYDEGFSLKIEPFTLTEDRKDIEVLMKNATEASSVEFDLVLPTAYKNKKAYTLETSTATTMEYDCSKKDNGDGSLHVSYARKGSNVIPKDAGCVLLLGLLYTDENENPLVSDPVCEFTIKNVIVTGTDETTEYKVAPYTGYFKVGTEAKGNISLEGDYSYVDLTDMDVDKTTSVTLSNPNGLIYVADGATIANTTNVIEGETCNDLVLTDKCAFAVPKAFTASKASYTRESGNNWGTICVPFELASDEKIQYFTLDASGVDLTNGTLTFTEASSVSAGTPAVFCRTDGGSMSLSATDASIAAGDAGVADGGLKLVGTYAPITITGDNYYIAKDAFWQADSKNVSVPAFRAYFKGTATGVKSFNINTDESTGVKSVTLEVDKQVIYDLMGRQLKNTEKGINIVNGKKVLVK